MPAHRHPAAYQMRLATPDDLAWITQLKARVYSSADALPCLPPRMRQRDWMAGCNAAVRLGWLTPIFVVPRERQGDVILAVSDAGQIACLRKASPYRAAAQRILDHGTAWYRAMQDVTADLLAFGSLFPRGDDEGEDAPWRSTHLPDLALPVCMPGEAGPRPPWPSAALRNSPPFTCRCSR
ncbi:MAG: hypothetical protein U0974_11825 [Gemmatimonadales bacterium]|nr:hypothetical protein [Gemmatimonadales bacterium]MDZ4390404.1 hypothetical protein [Gemmatimonadales bacterium]